MKIVDLWRSYLQNRKGDVFFRFTPNKCVKQRHCPLSTAKFGPVIHATPYLGLTYRKSYIRAFDTSTKIDMTMNT